MKVGYKFELYLLAINLGHTHFFLAICVLCNHLSGGAKFCKVFAQLSQSAASLPSLLYIVAMDTGFFIALSYTSTQNA